MGNDSSNSLSDSGDVRAPFVKMLRKGVLLAVHTRLETSEETDVEPFLTPPFGVGDAYMTAMHLRPMDRADIWRSGKSLGAIASPVGMLQICDLRLTWRALMFPPFETINLRIEQSMLDDAAREAGRDRTPMMRSFEDSRPDPVMHQLALALLPSFARPSELSALFADHVVQAAAAHLANLDGPGAPTPAGRGGNGLAPWQKRRVADMMRDRLEHDVTLQELARACGLSSGHFAKCFRETFGMPPHRWLLQERVRRAAEMMRDDRVGLNEVAVACGFVDQSHLGRVFRGVMNLTPAAWRRAQAQ